MGGSINLALQLTGFKWGYYLRNPHVSQAKRIIHRGLIFPFYLAHGWRENKEAVDIHLIDGGQSENSGAYALIRRRVPNIIISDHSSEAIPGNMEDICKLKKSLKLPEFSLNNKNMVWHIQFEKMQGLEYICSEDNIKTIPKEDRNVFNVWSWKNPIIEGCAIELTSDESTKISKTDTCETLKSKYAANNPDRHLNLFLIKTAIDLNKYKERPYSQLPKETSADLASTTEIVGFIRRPPEFE